MKKALAVLILLAMMTFAGSALADTQAWSTTNFNSMEHGTDYTWIVDDGAWFVPEDHVITSASLSITNLNNWYEPENDWMNIYLLNNPFAGWPQKELLTIYRDENGYSYTTTETVKVKKCIFLYCWYENETRTVTKYANPGENLLYNLSSDQIDTLTDYLADGIFGLGFDPNCHYYNNGMTFTVYTEKIPQIPEPAMMILLGLGILGLAGLRRKIK